MISQLRPVWMAAMLVLLTAQHGAAQQAAWRFGTDAEQVIGSVDLMRPDGTPLVALRCLAARTPVEARLAHPSAVARVAPERTVALLISPELLSAPWSQSLSVLRLPSGQAEQVLVSFEQPDGAPMAPLASGSAALAALAAGENVTLETAGGVPLMLGAPGLREGMAQLVQHCGLPVAPSGPAPFALATAPTTALPAAPVLQAAPAPAPVVDPAAPTAGAPPATAGTWRFLANSTPMIGSAELIGPDGRMIVALRCVMANTARDVRQTLPSAVGKVAARSDFVALVLAPDLLPDPAATNRVLLRTELGGPLQLRTQLVQPDNLPMASFTVNSWAFAALSRGLDVAVEPTDVLSVPLRAPGLQESMSSLTQFCDLQVRHMNPPPALPGTELSAPPPATGGAPSPVDMTRFDADLLLWTLGQWRNRPGYVAADHDYTSLSVLEQTFRELPVPGGYPPYPGRRNVPGEVVKAWADSMVDTAGQRATTPPEQFTLETQVRIETAADGRLYAFPAGAGTSNITVDYSNRDSDPMFTLREMRHAFAERFNLDVVVDRPLPLEVPTEAAPARVGSQQAMAVIRIQGRLSDYRTGSSHRALMATMAIERADLFEAVPSGRQHTAGRLLHTWDVTTRPVEAPAPSLASRATPEQIRAIYGTSVLEDRVLILGGAGDVSDFRPDLAPPERARLTRNPSVADTEAALAMRLAAVIRAAPDRPLSTAVALDVANQLLTAQERDTLFPPLTFQRNTPQLQRDGALRAADAVLKEAVLRLALPSRLAMSHLDMAQAQPFNAQFGVLQVNASVGERIWIAQLDPPLMVSEAVPMTEDQALQLLRYQTESGHPGRVVRRFDWTLVAEEGPPGRSGPIEPREIDLIALRAVPERLRLFADFGMTAVMFDQTFEAAPAGEPVPRDLYLTTWESLTAGKLALFPDLVDASLFGETLLIPQGIGTLPEPLRSAALAEEEARVRGLAREDYYLEWRLTLGEYDATRGGFTVSDREARLSIPHDQDLSKDPRRRQQSVDLPGIGMAEHVDIAFLPVPPEHRALVEGFRGNWNAMKVVLRGRLVPAAERDREDPRPTRFVPEEILFGPPSQRTAIDTVALRLPWPTPELAAPTAAVAAVTPPKALILDAEAVDLLVLRHAPELYDDRALERMLIERLARERAVAQERLRPGEVRRVLPWGQFFADPEAGLTPQARSALLPVFRAWSEARAAVLPDRMVLIGPGRSGKPGRAHDCATAFPMQEPRGHVGESLVDEVLGAGTWQGFIETVSRRRAYDRSVLEYPVAHFLPAGISRRVDGVGARCETAASLISRDQPGPAAFASGFDAAAAPQADLILIGDQALEMHGGGLATMFHLSDVQLAVRPVGPPGTPVVATVIMGAPTERVVALNPPAMPTLPPTEEDLWSPEIRAAQRGIPPGAQDILGLTLGIDRATFRAGALAHLGANVVEVTVAANPNDRHLGTASGFADPDSNEALLAIFARGADDGPVIALARRIILPLGTDPAVVMAALVEKYVPAGSPPEIVNETTLFVGLPANHLDSHHVCGRHITMGRMSGTETFAEGVDADLAGRYARGSFYNFGGVDDQGLDALVTPGSQRAPQVACGPAVVAAIQPQSTREGTFDALTVWLVDMSAAADVIRAIREAAPEAPKIRL